MVDSALHVASILDPPVLNAPTFRIESHGMQGQLLLSFLGLVHHLGKRQIVDSFAVEDEG